jgi:predicted tellurium resistance membrane protein TerC
MEVYFTSEALSSFAVLTLLEIVLGIDNLVFISILSEKLEPKSRQMAQRLGLLMAILTRLLFLGTLAWIAHMNKPLFMLGTLPVSWRSLILLFGGLFLIVKGTLEIHQKVERKPALEAPSGRPSRQVMKVIAQIAVMDMVFSIDSIVTAIGMAKHVEIMAAAIIVAMTVMILSVHQVSTFISNNPTIKMLALSFLLLIGTTLVAESFGVEVPKGYIYFAMLFSLFVEMINIWSHARGPAPSKGQDKTLPR